MNTESTARVSTRRLRLIGVVALVVAVGLAIAGMLARMHADRVYKSISEADAVPSVSLVDQRHEDAHQELVLPGDVKAFDDADLCACVRVT